MLKIIDIYNKIANKELKQKQEYYRYRKDNRYRAFLSNILDKIKELENINKKRYEDYKLRCEKADEKIKNIYMKYILKIYHKSKYLGFKKQEYIEFNTYEEIMIYLSKKKIKYDDYEIYAKVIL